MNFKGQRNYILVEEIEIVQKFAHKVIHFVHLRAYRSLSEKRLWLERFVPRD